MIVAGKGAPACLNTASLMLPLWFQSLVEVTIMPLTVILVALAATTMIAASLAKLGEKATARALAVPQVVEEPRAPVVAAVGLKLVVL